MRTTPLRSMLGWPAALLTAFAACGNDAPTTAGAPPASGSSDAGPTTAPAADAAPDSGHEHEHDHPDASTLPPGVRAFVPQPVHYPPIIAQPYVRQLPGDQSTPNGGTPPAAAYEPADIPTTGDITGLVQGDAAMNPPNGEAKARFICAASHIAADDPLRNWGVKGAAHLHQFFGHPTADAFSTYESLRGNTQNGTCAGGILNNTAYWFPCFVTTMPNGAPGCVRASSIVLYYNEGDLSLVPALQRIFRGFGYVFGVNMDDPDDLKAKAEVTAANAESIAAGGRGSYQYIGNGFAGYSCHLRDNEGTLVNGSGPNSPVPGGAVQPYLKNLDGTPTMPNCPAGGQLRVGIEGPTCWDGVNLQSYPSGYEHVRYGVREGDYAVERVCPTGWYRIPHSQVALFFPYEDPAELTNWRLSSDDHAAEMAGHPMENGRSFHTDWFGGWDYGTEEQPGVMLKWLHNCNGVRRPDGTNTPHDCNASTFSATEALNYGLVSQVPYEKYFPLP